MFGDNGQLLYVGKAKNLCARLTSYFREKGLDTKTLSLVSKLEKIEVTVTTTEVDALLLEHNLIKRHRPTYNILLKDDKSYPYIHLTNDAFPRMFVYRGSKKRRGYYFGPYPNSSAVRSSLQFLQKVFRIRNCEDSYFKNRSRPCLQYQIERCSAPCVDLVSEDEYAEQVRDARLFLKGRSRELMKRLADDMECASESLQYERAARYRDQLKQLQHIQASQEIEGIRGDLDIVAACVKGGKACVQMLYVRHGRVVGSKSFFPPLRLTNEPRDVIEGFLPQFYLHTSNSIPPEILTSEPLDYASVLADALSAKLMRKVKIRNRVREARAKWIGLAVQSAETNLASHLAKRESAQQRMKYLGLLLNMPFVPKRIECFDISHSGGEAPVASCIVFDDEGARKTDYRKFNIEGITPGDDYAAMEQAVKRRYKRLQAGEGVIPDILMIDGRKGQISKVTEVLKNLSIDSLNVLGVAKGEGRRAGDEILIDGSSNRIWSLKSDDPALHIIQQIRDEAHRFALTGHRARRDKKIRKTRLDEIEGIGPKRRRELLRHFGSVAGIQSASVLELKKLEGISATIAHRIYNHFHHT